MRRRAHLPPGGSRLRTSTRSATLVTVLLLAVLFPVLPAPAAPPPSPPALGDLAFEPNLGQLPDGVAFAARAPGFSLFVLADGSLAALAPGEAPVALRFVGARPASIDGADPLAGRLHYLLGDDPAAWTTDVPRFSRVVVRDAWPGIDVSIRSDADGNPEYDLLASPRADFSRVAFSVEGAEAERTADGAILAGPFVQRAPVAWQTRDGAREPVGAAFEPDGALFRLRIVGWDRALPLVVDPILGRAGFHGANGDDVAMGAALDASGNLVVAGSTTSAAFPTLDPLQPARGGARDAFVSSFAPDGTLRWSTFLGGALDDSAEDLARAPDGAFLVAGTTASTNFPVASPLQAVNRGRTDAFALKLAADGSALVWSTYLGGSTVGSPSWGNDAAFAIAAGPSGEACLAGKTESQDFPTSGAPQPARAGAADAFVACIGAAGSPLLWGTYLGGGFNDQVNDLAVDAAGRVVAVGQTGSANFPTVAAFDGTFGGIVDGFAARYAPGGAAVEWSTFLGGAKDEYAAAVALDSAGAPFVTGMTWSEDFPVLSPLQPFGNHVEPPPGGEEEHPKADAFVLALLGGGTGLAWGTWLGGLGLDVGSAIEVAADGSVTVAGRTESFDFPVVDPVQATKADPGLFVYDMFAARYAPGGTAVAFASYVGGYGGASIAHALALDSSGGAWLAGQTSTSRFPATGGFDATHNGGNDVAIARLAPGTPTLPTSPLAVTATTGPARGQITVRWQPPADLGGAILTKYVVRSGAASGSLAWTADSTSLSFVHNGLADGATRWYSVAAVTGAGEGAASSEASATTWSRPSVPLGLVAESGSGLAQVTLDWSAPASGGAQSYRIFRGFVEGGESTLVAEIPGARTAFTDDPPVPALTYWYRVAAVNPAGEGPRTASVSAQALALPLP